MKLFKSAFFFLIGIIILLPSLSLAEVDGDEKSIEKDRGQMGATVTIRKGLKYQIYDLESRYTTVHEFLDLNGRVFGVTWSGRTPPHLSLILGKHFDEYESELARVPRVKGRRNFQTVITSKLRIAQAGHLGHFSGSAFLLGHMPEGVTDTQIMKDSVGK